jgi:hypothetical protein
MPPSPGFAGVGGAVQDVGPVLVLFDEQPVRCGREGDLDHRRVSRAVDAAPGGAAILGPGQVRGEVGAGHVDLQPDLERTEKVRTSGVPIHWGTEGPGRARVLRTGDEVIEGFAGRDGKPVDLIAESGPQSE